MNKYMISILLSMTLLCTAQSANAMLARGFFARGGAGGTVGVTMQAGAQASYIAPRVAQTGVHTYQDLLRMPTMRSLFFSSKGTALVPVRVAAVSSVLTPPNLHLVNSIAEIKHTAGVRCASTSAAGSDDETELKKVVKKKKFEEAKQKFGEIFDAGGDLDELRGTYGSSMILTSEFMEFIYDEFLHDLDPKKSTEPHPMLEGYKYKYKGVQFFLHAMMRRLPKEKTHALAHKILDTSLLFESSPELVCSVLDSKYVTQQEKEAFYRDVVHYGKPGYLKQKLFEIGTDELNMLLADTILKNHLTLDKENFMMCVHETINKYASPQARAWFCKSITENILSSSRDKIMMALKNGVRENKGHLVDAVLKNYFILDEEVLRDVLEWNTDVIREHGSPEVRAWFCNNSIDRIDSVVPYESRMLFEIGTDETNTRLADIILKNPTKNSTSVILESIRNVPEGCMIEAMKSINSSNASQVLKDVLTLYAARIMDDKAVNPAAILLPNTQTSGHLSVASLPLLGKIIENILAPSGSVSSSRLCGTFDEELLGVFDELHAKEENIRATTENYTFYHGMKQSLAFLTDVNNILHEVTHNTDLGAFSLFRMIRADGTMVDNFNNDQQLQEDEDVFCQRLVDNGIGSRSDTIDRARLLFMNARLFGNTKELGSCSAHYVGANRNINEPGISLEQAFEAQGLGHLYERYQERLEHLTTEHHAISDCGRMFLLSFTPEALEKYVYIAHPGGLKKEVYIDGVGNTSDMKLILDTLRTAPEKIDDADRMEFCHVLIQKTLKPGNGIEVHSFQPGDKEKVAAYQRKLAQLKADLRNDIAAQVNVKQTA